MLSRRGATSACWQARHDSQPRSQSQSHGHASGDEQIAQLEQGGELYVPFHEQAFAWLAELRAPAEVQRVLDIGSGAGVSTSVLARAFAQAEVIAVDGAAVLLAPAEQRAARVGVADRVRVLQADLPAGVRAGFSGVAG